MSEHRFKIGQALDFMPHRSGARPGKCKVIRLLPADSDDPPYRIKCTNENFERVVRESELA